jgi:cell wall assembly regulator SMI1
MWLASLRLRREAKSNYTMNRTRDQQLSYPSRSQRAGYRGRSAARAGSLMSVKRPRVIGTTEDSILKAEADLSCRFPPSFRLWLLTNNGLGAEGVSIFPVLDERDARKTWDSIVRNYRVNWSEWKANFQDLGCAFEHLLPFAEYGTGDYYCFDYSRLRNDGEVPIVHWCHDTGEIEDRARTFAEFLEKLIQGEYEAD